MKVREEYLSQQELKRLQSKRLIELVDYCYKNSKLYKKKFNGVGIKPVDIKSIEDIGKLPFTTKEDLRELWPTGNFAAPMTKIKKIHTTSGTTGKPTVIGFTDKDWEEVIELAGRAMNASTINEKDIVQNTTPYGMFFAGASTQGGAEIAGAAVIPAGPGNLDQQLFYIKEFKPTVIMGVPSFVLHLAKEAEKRGINPKKTSLRKAFLLGEPITKATAKRIKDTWGIETYSGYGITEVGVSGTCTEKDGYHWPTDKVYVEIVNPDTGKPVRDGELGEAVFTTLTRRGVPLIRFRSRDLTRILPKCKCGRTLPKLELISGRLDDRTKIKGTLVLPKEIEEGVLSIKEVENYLAVVKKTETEFDEFTIYYEAEKEVSSKIVQSVKALTNLKPKVIRVQRGGIPKGDRKAKRFIDSRKGKKFELDLLKLLGENING